MWLLPRLLFAFSGVAAIWVYSRATACKKQLGSGHALDTTSEQDQDAWRQFNNFSGSDTVKSYVDLGLDDSASYEDRPIMSISAFVRNLHESWNHTAANKLHDLEAQLRAENERHEAKVKMLQKQISRLKEASDGSEENQVEISTGKKIQWGIASIIFAALVGCCCTVAQCGCLIFFCWYAPHSFVSECFTINAFAEVGYIVLDSPAAIGLIVRREVRLMMLYPLIPWIAFSETTCLQGPPNWVYYVYIPLLIRAKYVEFRLLQKLGKGEFVWTVASVLGTLEHFDYFTDGIFPLQALKCDPDVTHMFAKSFLDSKVPFVAPVVNSLHFSGVALMLLCATLFAQQALASVRIGPRTVPDSIEAEVAGFGGLAKYYDKEADRNAGDSLFFIAVVRTLLENCLQLWIQSSFFGLVFSQISFTAKLKLLLSMSLGMLSASYKAVSMFMWMFTTNSDLAACKPIVALFPALILLMVVWIGAKLYFAYTCPDHIWNLTSGCVPM